MKTIVAQASDTYPRSLCIVKVMYMYITCFSYFWSIKNVLAWLSCTILLTFITFTIHIALAVDHTINIITLHVKTLAFKPLFM